MITGLDASSLKNLQLNAGIFLKNFDYSSYTDAASLRDAIVEAAKNVENRIGATRGGGTFQCTPDTREIEADGKRYSYVGSTMYDSWDIKLTTTLLEATPGNFKLAMGSADVTTTGSISKLTLRTEPKESDYIKSLVWVGDTSQGFVLIDMKNALNATGINLTFTDKGEGTIPLEMHAHQDSVGDLDLAPVTVLLIGSGEAEMKSKDGIEVAQVNSKETEATAQVAAEGTTPVARAEASSDESSAKRKRAKA